MEESGSISRHLKYLWRAAGQAHLGSEEPSPGQVFALSGNILVVLNPTVLFACFVDAFQE